MSRSAEYLSKPSTRQLRVQAHAKAQPGAKKNLQDEQWKKELASATTSVYDLLNQLKLTQHVSTTNAQPDFKCLATQSYIKKIQPGNFEDPLLLQILPLSKENDRYEQQLGVVDPVGDIDAMATTGLLHKYHGRALLISTGACAIHCRYCFRRTYPYQSASCTSKALDDTLLYLKTHTEIDEIILSGGDPLILDDEKLANLISQLESIDHIQTLRIHTRLPIVLPSRINKPLIQILRSTRFHVVMVIHANHANELQAEEQLKLQSLHEAGINLLNQSVLLKGINDNAIALTALSKRLLQCNTIPYYLHQLDPVIGAMHFSISNRKALSLIHQLNEQLPGYLVPRLVQELAGKKAKSAIFHI
jgi:EF-P beta-lysylation protein EpmB